MGLKKSSMLHSFLIVLACTLFHAHAVAKKLDVAVGWTKPPYVIAEGNTGFELDLMAAVCKQLGHEIVPLYVPFGRSYTMLKDGEVDITLTLTDRADIKQSRLSDVYVVYQNVAISLKEKKLAIDEISDLANVTIVAFQNANIVLGSEFASVVKTSPLYIELPNQSRQVEMLLMGNTEVVVMDINIFNHLSRNFLGSNPMPEITVHKLFPASPYKAGFRDVALKQQFDFYLSLYKQSPAYTELLNKYGFTRSMQEQLSVD